jgi:hypothetical protein
VYEQTLPAKFVLVQVYAPFAGAWDRGAHSTRTQSLGAVAAVAVVDFPASQAVQAASESAVALNVPNAQATLAAVADDPAV